MTPNPTPALTLMKPAYWYHTDRDTVESISPEGIEHAARTFTELTETINCATIEEIRKGWPPPRAKRLEEFK